jgi:hypothetical protein
MQGGMQVEHFGTSTSVAFFDKAFAAFLQAVPTPIERYYHIAGSVVRVLFSSHETVSLLTAALEHLEISHASSFELTLCVWDSVSTQASMVSPPWSQEEYLTRGAIRGFDDEKCRVAFHMGSSALSVLHQEKKTALFWTRDFSRLPFWEKGAPFLTILHWWLAERRIQLVHAAAIGTEKGGVLLVGKGGSGKSTTALSALLQGNLYVNDDYSAVTVDPPYIVHSLYNTGKCDAASLNRLPDLIRLVNDSPADSKEKALIFLHRHFPSLIVPSLPIRAIVLPKIHNGPSCAVTRASPAEALMALAPSTLFQLANAGSGAFQALAKLAKEVPSFTLHLEDDMKKNVEAINEILSVC